METKLALISRKAHEDRSMKFDNLMHLFNVQNLCKCFKRLKKNRAPGVDKVTLEEYGLNLIENVANLVNRIKQLSYRPQPVRRVYIPKSNGKPRPLGIPTIEDKMVQMMFALILEAIWEQDFLPISYGFRPKKGCQLALRDLNEILRKQPVGYVIDADIVGYFDNVNHEKLLNCLERRVADKKFLRYIVRMLKSGIMDGRNYFAPGKGTPQGGVASPILANIYLHYLLDVWFIRKIRPHCSGYVEMVRYCDDFLICVEKKEDVAFVYRQLEKRMGIGRLELSKEKTEIIEFRKPRNGNEGNRSNKPGSFNFLGFTHYWEKSRKGFYRVGRKTQKERYHKAVGKVNEWLRKNRNFLTTGELWKRVSQMLTGHFSYYGVSGNYKKISNFHYRVTRLFFKWLNRRSQKKSHNWKRFNDYLKLFPLPKVKIYHKFY